MELLVVISIVALLIALLLPALGRAREHARRAACLAHERGMGQAFALYAQDRKDFPTSTVYTGSTLKVLYLLNGGVATLLADYGISYDPAVLWKCPSAGAVPRGPASVGGTAVYFIDQYQVLTALAGEPTYTGALSPRRPGDKTGPLVSDILVWWYAFAGYPSWSSSHGRWNAGGDPQSSDRFGPDGINEVFSDGHARWVACAELPDAPASGWFFNPGMSWPRYYWGEKP